MFFSSDVGERVGKTGGMAVNDNDTYLGTRCGIGCLLRVCLYYSKMLFLKQGGLCDYYDSMDGKEEMGYHEYAFFYASWRNDGIL